ncbi:MAG: Rne/Rng family ribonuclease [Candidatus Omnitrophica bacterium]|nr:Rne/Rng family ribonuclease [Candidatus Omnitrophota bacterium]
MSQILIDVTPEERRIALIENSQLQEFYIERSREETIVGNIYKAKVKSIVEGIEAAFIDLGLEKEGFLYTSLHSSESDYFDELNTEASDGENNESLLAGGGKPLVLKNGQEVLVQVVKQSMGKKGPRLSTRLALAGRYSVLMPLCPALSAKGISKGVSRKIKDLSERERIKKVINELRIPRGMSIIARTAAEGKDKKEFLRDVSYLMNLWRYLRRNIIRKSAPSLLYRELDLALKVIRDCSENVEEIIVNDEQECKRIVVFSRRYLPALTSKIRYVESSLLENYEKDIEKIFSREIRLKGGGSIIIEQTEALISIDVNSGRFKGKNMEETSMRTNYEACREIARQLRLRNIGGIVIIDFIDMKLAESRRKILSALDKFLSKDRARIKLLSFSEIGVVELTRQRRTPSLENLLYQTCSYCQGKGLLKTLDTMVIEALTKIRKDVQKRDVEINVHPQVALHLLNERKAVLLSLENKFKHRITVKPYTM